jgi:hypothetical protein
MMMGESTAVERSLESGVHSLEGAERWAGFWLAGPLPLDAPEAGRGAEQTTRVARQEAILGEGEAWRGWGYLWWRRVRAWQWFWARYR